VRLALWLLGTTATAGMLVSFARIVAEATVSKKLCPSCGERHDDSLEDCPYGPLSERGETILRRGLCCGEE
jgi:hypothetical protein